MVRHLLLGHFVTKAMASPGFCAREGRKETETYDAEDVDWVKNG